MYQCVCDCVIVDESNFLLKDNRTETEFKFKLQDSLLRARERPLFQDITFYLTPSVVPGKPILQEIIENAGGKIVPKRPSIRHMIEKKTAQVGLWMRTKSC